MARTTCVDAPDVSLAPARVAVSMFEADWNDLPDTTAQRAEQDIRKQPAGCWYWNPRFTVHCPCPIRAFFQKARRCQADWYRTMSRTFGSANSRREERSISSDPLRRLTFGGLLVIDGDVVDERQWTLLEAQLGLRPEANVVVTRRSVDLTDMAQTGRHGALIEIVRSELRQHMDLSPGRPAYVTPGISVTAPAADAAFFAEAQKRNAEWHRRLERKVGNSQRRQLIKAADLATRMLVYHGVLVVDGLFYEPGRWPHPSDAGPPVTARSGRVSTLPAKVLGLASEVVKPACSPTRLALDDDGDCHPLFPHSPQSGGFK